MRVLLLGGYGQLGAALRRTAGGREIEAPTRDELDITDGAAVRGLAERVRPEVVINAAAYTRVDDAETNASEALRVNFEAAAGVASAAEAVGAALVFISTDYVFDGSKREPYEPEDEPHPLSVYGVSKLYGEHASATATRHWVVRVAGLYGDPSSPRAPGHFVATVLRLARERGALEIVADQVTAPSSAGDVATALWELLDRGPPSGIYHLPQGGQCSWLEFAQAVVELAGVEATVSPTTAEALGRPAPRPAYSVLGGGKARAAGVAPLRPWREALAAYLHERSGDGQATED